MKTKLYNVVVDENLSLIDTSKQDVVGNAVQLDEMIDFAIQGLGVDPSDIIKRARFHILTKINNKRSK